MSSSNIPKHFFSLFAAIMIIIQLVYVNPKSTIEFKNQDEKRIIETRVALITIISLVILNTLYMIEKGFNPMFILSLVTIIIQIIYITMSPQTQGIIITNFILLIMCLIYIIFESIILN
jgi:hypothetical protein